MAEEQDPDVPDSLKSSIYAAYIQGLDIYEMYESLWIPAKYTDAIDELWESWVEEDKKNPPEPGVARMIPTEWPSNDVDEDDETSESSDVEEYGVLLDRFRRRFGELFELFDKGTPDSVAAEVVSIYREFRHKTAIREEFLLFLRSSSKYLRKIGDRNLVEYILEDIPFPISFAAMDDPKASVIEELSIIKALIPRQTFPIQPEKRIDEDIPEID